MTKDKKAPQRSGSKHHKATPHSLRTFHSKTMKDARAKKQRKASEKKDYKDARCSVCMEYPHNAVLLLCSSYHKGCRPYMCATSYRYSNCLDQYKKAYSKENSTQKAQLPDGSNDGPSELMCPLCRGQVKGWTVVERARKFFNSKKRSCMQDECSFVGSYKNLRKHVREDHPLARPREVDPSLAEKWKKLENDTELNDVMSTISSTMPGSIIMGDYVIEGNFQGFQRDMEMENYLDNVFFRLGSRTARGGYAILERDDDDDDDVDDDDDDDDEDDEDDDDDEDDEDAASQAASGHARNYIPRVARRQGRLLLGRSRRRHRHNVDM